MILIAERMHIHTLVKELGQIFELKEETDKGSAHNAVLLNLLKAIYRVHRTFVS